MRYQLKTYDELFKKQCKEFFQKFATVITDYEIVKLPKKADILIIEMYAKLNTKLEIFNYFEEYNIIEFKSVADHFKVGEDDLKISFYINGVLLQEKDANVNNTTFTLVSSGKPEAFLKKFKDKIQTIRTGHYRLVDIALIPVNIVVITEIEGDFTEEYKLLKEFSKGSDLEKFIRQFLKKYDKIKDNDTFDVLLSLYGIDVIKIMKELDMHTNIIETNINYLVEELGMKDKFKLEGKDEGNVEGKQNLFIGLLKRKFSITDAEAKQIKKCNDEEKLEVASFKLMDGFSKDEILSVFLHG